MGESSSQNWTKIPGDIPGFDIGSCGIFSNIKEISETCGKDDNCIGYTTKHPDCNRGISIEQCRAGIQRPPTVPRVPWCMKSRDALGNTEKLNIKRNNAYGEELTLKTQYFNNVSQPPTDVSWGITQWQDVEYENPVFGDLPGGDIKM